MVSQIKILHIFLANLVHIGSVQLCHFLVKDEMVSLIISGVQCGGHCIWALTVLPTPASINTIFYALGSRCYAVCLVLILV